MEQKTKKLTKYISCKDHCVSGEFFCLYYDSDLQMLITSPAPKESEADRYYKGQVYQPHSHQQRTLFQKTYSLVRRFSIQQKLRKISKFIDNNKRILDVGAGLGDFVHAADRKGWNCKGVEINSDAVQAANSKGKQFIFPMSYLNQIKAHSLSVITLWHVLEHLPEFELKIQTFKSLLSQEGRLVVAAPNFRSYDAKYFKNCWAAYDPPRHLWHFSQKSISLIFDKFDMEVESVSPMLFDAFYVSLLSTKYQSGKMRILKAFFVALLSNLKAFYTGEYSSIIYVIKNKKKQFKAP